MNKIPTLYVRDPADMSRVTREVTPGCEWVLAGEGIPTRKWDGTNIRVTVRGGSLIVVEKRKNPTREEKAKGAEPGYVEASRSEPADKHIFAAVDAMSCAAKWADVPDGQWPGEAVGPKIQGGADGMPPFVVMFSLPGWAQENELVLFRPVGDLFDGMRNVLTFANMEGIVWHHPDGRMAKIKRRDFGLPWPVRYRLGEGTSDV